MTPRSDGKSGVEAVVEEGRTNLVLNSYFSNNYTNWVLAGSGATWSIDNKDAVYSKSVRFDKTEIINSPSIYTSRFNVVAGTTYSASAYYRSSEFAGGVGQIYMRWYDNTGTFISNSSTLSTNQSTSWTRVSVTSAAPANAVTADFILRAQTNFLGKLWYGAAQVEAGGFASSYIPTTTTTVTRSADDISVPTTNWNINAGAFIATLGRTIWSGGAAYPRIISWSDGSSSELITMSFSNPTTFTFDMNTRHGGVWGTSAIGAGLPVYGSVAYRYDSSGLKHRVFVDGAGGVEASMSQYPSGLQATAGIGLTSAGGSYLNGPIQRLTIYDSALSDSAISTASTALKDGLQ